MTLNAGRYVIIPTTFEPRQFSAFYFDVFSSQPVHCQIAKESLPQFVIEMAFHIHPNRFCLEERGQWRGKTAGGCVNHDSWKNNLSFRLDAPKSTFHVKVFSFEVWNNIVESIRYYHYPSSIQPNTTLHWFPHFFTE